MSISTQRGDTGETSLIGGRRVSKADLRVEAHGPSDELISVMGFARSICENDEVRERTKAIQRELFAVSSAVAAGSEKKPGKKREPPAVPKALVEGMRPLRPSTWPAPPAAARSARWCDSGRPARKCLLTFWLISIVSRIFSGYSAGGWKRRPERVAPSAPARIPGPDGVGAGGGTALAKPC